MQLDQLFFDGFASLIRSVVVGVLAYAALLVTLRITGKRTLAKLNAFDLIVTVALGSTLATALLSKDTALAEGVLALLLLCGLQYCVSWLSVRSKWVRDLVKSEPCLVVHNGRALEAALKKERLTIDEVEAALRAAQLHDISEADAVVLETNGKLSVIPRSDTFTAETLPGIRPNAGSET